MDRVSGTIEPRTIEPGTIEPDSAFQKQLIIKRGSKTELAGTVREPLAQSQPGERAGAVRSPDTKRLGPHNSHTSALGLLRNHYP